MGVMRGRNWQYIVLLAMIAFTASGCGDGDQSAAVPPANQPTAEADDAGTSRPPTSPDVSASTTDASTTAPPATPAAQSASRPGDEIGFGSVGPPIESPEPWPTLTIYSGFEPGILGVDFSPPDPNCIAAEATATVGRGGAILVRLWVEDSSAVVEPCPGNADAYQVRILLTEPIGDRRIYTHVGSEQIEQLADEIIGMDATEAIEMIRDAGFEMRDNTGQETVESDADANRININTSDGVIEFARVG